jgi:hypothetical protein
MRQSIIWHNSETHETQIWFMDAERLRRRGTVLGEDGQAVFIGPPFSIVAAGSINRQALQTLQRNLIHQHYWPKAGGWDASAFPLSRYSSPGPRQPGSIGGGDDPIAG